MFLGYNLTSHVEATFFQMSAWKVLYIMPPANIFSEVTCHDTDEGIQSKLERLELQGNQNTFLEQLLYVATTISCSTNLHNSVRGR
jgi:hypothetical protein